MNSEGKNKIRRAWQKARTLTRQIYQPKSGSWGTRTNRRSTQFCEEANRLNYAQYPTTKDTKSTKEEEMILKSHRFSFVIVRPSCSSCTSW
jgi:hypothetical protein